MSSPADRAGGAATDPCRPLEEFWAALGDAEEHLRIAYETATIDKGWWEELPGWGWRIRREYRPDLEKEVNGVLDTRKRLHTLASEVVAHIVPPAGETGQQWVLGVLALADKAADLAEHEYGRCERYRGPMGPGFVAENPDIEKWRRQFRDDLRQIENDYQRVCSGLSEAREHLDRVMSVVQPQEPPAAKTNKGEANGGAGTARKDGVLVDRRRLPDLADSQAVTLPEARNLQEFFDFVAAVCKHLDAMTGGWWCRQHPGGRSGPSIGPNGEPNYVVVDAESEAAYCRRVAARRYRDQLRTQLLHLCLRTSLNPPERNPDAERDIEECTGAVGAAITKRRRQDTDTGPGGRRGRDGTEG